MRLHHLALARTSEAASDRFYVDLLGLEKRREKHVDADLCRALFGVARGHKLIDYAGDGVQFEIFLVPPGGSARSDSRTSASRLAMRPDSWRAAGRPAWRFVKWSAASAR